MSSKRPLVLFTQSDQNKYRVALEGPGLSWNFDYVWSPLISFQPITNQPLQIPTQDVLISSTKTLDYLDWTLLLGKRIHVVGEGTADRIRNRKGYQITSIHNSSTDVKINGKCSFLGASIPTESTLLHIEKGDYLHIPIYERIEHRTYTFSQQFG